MKTENQKTLDLDELYQRALDAFNAYIDNDALDVAVFLNAFRAFYAVMKTARRRRFHDAAPLFDAFANVCGEIETNVDAFNSWNAWNNAREIVARFDRAEKARLTPPEKSIDELIALGVSRSIIAKIYGFKRADGSPDIDAVENRAKWTPPAPSPLDVAPDNVEEIARLASDALQRIANEGVAALVNREILDGVPLRQIAVRHNITVDDVKQHAAALNVTAVVSADELPPRIVKRIEAARADVANGSKTYRQIARLVSSNERRVSELDVRRVLEQG